MKKIESLATAVAGIESVFNPIAAGGGSDEADTEAMLTIGPRQISHRDRAVSVKDFEDLALEASRQVAKVRCLAATSLARRGVGAPDPCDRGQRHEARPERGTVSLILVPQASGLGDARPCPSLELRRTVMDYLGRRCPALVAEGGRIVIRPPDYVEVTVEADVFVTSIDKTATVEAGVRKRLLELLHPLLGGPDGDGWDFGRPLRSSDVFAVLERIADVDRVEGLRFHFRGRTDAEEVRIAAHELIASGDHVVRMRVRES